MNWPNKAWIAYSKLVKLASKLAHLYKLHILQALFGLSMQSMLCSGLGLVGNIYIYVYIVM
jgi:hypothetical protein